MLTDDNELCDATLDAEEIGSAVSADEVVLDDEAPAFEGDDGVAVEASDEDAVIRVTGLCKWFDDKRGFGFITPLSAIAMSLDGMSTDRSQDVFVHIQQLKPKISTWKCLYTGEYVEYTPELKDGRVRATNVTGINGGTLMVDYGIIEFSRYYKRQFSTRTNVEHAKQVRKDAPAVRPTTIGDVGVEKSRKRNQRRRGRRGQRKRRKVVTAIQQNPDRVSVQPLDVSSSAAADNSDAATV